MRGSWRESPVWSLFVGHGFLGNMIQMEGKQGVFCTELIPNKRRCQTSNTSHTPWKEMLGKRGHDEVSTEDECR